MRMLLVGVCGLWYAFKVDWEMNRTTFPLCVGAIF